MEKMIVISTLLMPLCAFGAVIIESSNGADPLAAGFMLSSSGVVETGSGFDTEPYWFTNTTEKAAYYRDIDAANFSDPDGWTFTLRAKSLSANHTNVQDNWWCVRDATDRWDLLAVAGDGTNPVGVRTLTSTYGWFAIDETLDVTEYHTYNLIYNPTDSTVSAYIDGIWGATYTRADAYNVSVPASDLEIRGGDQSGVNPGGHENRYSMIRFETGMKRLFVPVVPFQIGEGETTDYIYYVGPIGSPSQTVQITITTDGQTTVNGQSQIILTYVPGDPETAMQMVTVAAVDDSNAEGDHSSVITHTTVSVDSAYNGVSETVTGLIYDNDAIIESSNGADPLLAGFSFIGSGTYSTGTGNDGETHWFVNSNRSAAYYTAEGVLTAADFSDPSGWTATWRTKTLSENFVGMPDNFCCARDGTNRFDFSVCAGTETNDPGVYLLLNTGYIALDTDVDVTQYHTYQMTYDPATTSVSFYIDGYLKGTYARSQMYTTTLAELRWGDQYSTTTASHENRYSLVRFEIGQHPITPIILSKTSAGVAEDPLNMSSDAFEISLGWEPSDSVTVSFNTDNQLLPIPQRVFTSGNWDQPQAITIKAIDDGLSEGPHFSNIGVSVQSSDPWFDDYALSDVIVRIQDNEPWCGQPGTVYYEGDLNRDCIVGMADFSILALHWMKCTSPVFPLDCEVTEFATILETQVIAHEPGRYCAWPSIAQAFNGDIIVSYTGDSDCHGCDPSLARLVSSLDSGTSWSQLRNLYEMSESTSGHGVLTTHNGTMLLCWTLDSTVDERIARSLDGGISWGDDTGVSVRTPHGPIQLQDGRLLYIGGGEVLHSLDEGRTWIQIATVSANPEDPPSIYAPTSEVHACQTQNGKIVALHRYRNGDDSNLRQFESYDGGYTWTVPHKTDMVGYPAHLLTLRNGWLLATYGRRVPPMGQRACVSYDEGQTWDTANEVVISNLRGDVSQNSGHLGYPASLQLPDDTILTVYYQINDPADGEFPSILCTHWRLNVIF